MASFGRPHEISGNSEVGAPAAQRAGIYGEFSAADLLAFGTIRSDSRTNQSSKGSIRTTSDIEEELDFQSYQVDFAQTVALATGEDPGEHRGYPLLSSLFPESDLSFHEIVDLPDLIYGEFTVADLFLLKGSLLDGASLSRKGSVQTAVDSEDQRSRIRDEDTTAQMLAFGAASKSSPLDVENRSQRFTIRSADLDIKGTGSTLEAKLEAVRDSTLQSSASNYNLYHRDHPSEPILPELPFTSKDNKKEPGFYKTRSQNTLHHASGSTNTSASDSTESIFDRKHRSRTDSSESDASALSSRDSIANPGTVKPPALAGEPIPGEETNPISSLIIEHPLEEQLDQEEPTSHHIASGTIEPDETAVVSSIPRANLEYLEQAVQTMDLMKVNNPLSLNFFLENVRAIKRLVRYFGLQEFGSPLEEAGINKGNIPEIEPQERVAFIEETEANQEVEANEDSDLETKSQELGPPTEEIVSPIKEIKGDQTSNPKIKSRLQTLISSFIKARSSQGLKHKFKSQEFLSPIKKAEGNEGSNLNTRSQELVSPIEEIEKELSNLNTKPQEVVSSVAEAEADRGNNLRTKSQEHQKSEARTETSSRLGSHLIPSMIADSTNWSDLRRSLPPLFQFATFAHNVWTVDATDLPPPLVSSLPLRIAQKPVILNYVPPIFASFDCPDDPAAGNPIDAKRDLADDMLRLLFRTYPKATAACVLFNQTLLILHDDKLNLENELRQRPRKFGGLRVSYIASKQSFTTGPEYRRSTSSLFIPANPESLTRDVGFQVEVAYAPESSEVKTTSKSLAWHKVGAGLRIRHKTTGMDAITFTMHGLLNAAYNTVKTSDNHLADFEKRTRSFEREYMENIKNRFKFRFQDKKFGTIYKDFESNIKAIPNDPSPKASKNGIDHKLFSFKHDLVLVKALPEKSHRMPHLVFRDRTGNPVEMEWMDEKDESFILNPIYLLGFKFSARNSTKTDFTTPYTNGVVIFSSKIPESPEILRDSGSIGGQPSLSETLPDALGISPQVPMELEPKESSDITPISNATNEKTTFKNSSSETSTITEITGQIMGRLYAQRSLSPSKVEKLRVRSDVREYFQRSYIWRSDFTQDEHGELKFVGDYVNGLPDIHGASGCPLAIKVVEGDKVKYKIFGFQNTQVELENQPDEPGMDEDIRLEGALRANFRTYQSLYLPLSLTQEWEIVWRPGQKGENKLREREEAQANRARFQNWRRFGTDLKGLFPDVRKPFH
ncbi:hypothetical protein ABW20_dc0108965 [Dactylellina cionopaga]|nr:hypothetical protein ABW20_dc0108965 [Dactylellina cionopaga]